MRGNIWDAVKKDMRNVASDGSGMMASTEGGGSFKPSLKEGEGLVRRVSEAKARQLYITIYNITFNILLAC